VNYLVLGLAAAHATYLYLCFIWVSGTPYVEGFAIAVAAFIGYLNCVGLHV